MAKQKGKSKSISLDEIRKVLDEAQPDVEKFNNGVNAPGSRIRKAAQSIKGLCQGIRNDVTEIKNAR